MPKTFPLVVKEKALELYLQGYSSKDISESLRTQFSNNVTQSTVYAWIKEGEWEDRKKENHAASIEHIQETEGQKLNRLQREHFDSYESLRHKATHELEFLQFDREADAAKALYLGIKGERQIMEGLINLQFVQSVLSVLVEEINDEDILKRVAGRLKGLIQTEEPSVA